MNTRMLICVAWIAIALLTALPGIGGEAGKTILTMKDSGARIDDRQASQLIFKQGLTKIRFKKGRNT